MDIRYMNDDEFVPYIKSLSYEHKQVISVDGKNRWKIKFENEEYILRPESSRV